MYASINRNSSQSGYLHVKLFFKNVSSVKSWCKEWAPHSRKYCVWCYKAASFQVTYTASEAHCLLDASHHQSMTLQGKQRNLKKGKNIPPPPPNTGTVKNASLWSHRKCHFLLKISKSPGDHNSYIRILNRLVNWSFRACRGFCQCYGDLPHSITLHLALIIIDITNSLILLTNLVICFIFMQSIPIWP